MVVLALVAVEASGVSEALETPAGQCVADVPGERVDVSAAVAGAARLPRHQRVPKVTIRTPIHQSYVVKQLREIRDLPGT